MAPLAELDAAKSFAEVADDAVAAAAVPPPVDDGETSR
jgi:hypothetical protein